MSERWTPTTVEVFQGTIAVLSDALPPSVDALFLHGSPFRDDRVDRQILQYALELHRRGMVGSIVLNGLTRAECLDRNLAYHGFEAWEGFLLERGVPRASIVLLPPSVHTGVESRNLLVLAKERGWRTLAISSQAYHQLRCFLQIIALMPEVEWHPDVYNAPAPGIPWGYPMTKPVMKGSTVFTANVTGLLSDHIDGELQRIEAYAQQPTAEKPFTRHATLPQMFDYLRTRR